MTLKIQWTGLVIAVVGTLEFSGVAVAGPPLETELARLPEQGHGAVYVNAEYQTARDGSELALPLEFEYGLTDRLEIAIEPVVFTKINPKTGAGASGFGDTEITLTYLLFDETNQIPAIAIAGEVKIPTTKDPLIGTGANDYRAFGILSKRFGPYDVHFNLGYTFVGQTSGGSYNDIIDASVAVQYELTPQVSLVGEVLANTSAGGNESTVGATRELASSNVTAMVGAAFKPVEGLELSLGVTRDTDKATLFRIGAGLRF